MLLEVALATSLLAHLRHPFGEPQQIIRTYGTGGWLLQVQRDRFSGQVRCRLTGWRLPQPRMTFASGVVWFRFAPRTDTLDAWYRIDGAPARRWQDLYPELSQAGVELEGPSLDHPTGGVVALPLRLVVGARQVTIRPTPRSQPRTFTMGGLQEAVDAARAQGCVADSAFVR